MSIPAPSAGSEANGQRTDVDYGDPPPAVEASISALTCADEAFWGGDDPDGAPYRADSAHVQTSST